MPHKVEEIDPVLYSYQSAIAALMRNQQMALASLLAASAVAHMPLQPELCPVETPQVSRSKTASDAKSRGGKSGVAKAKGKNKKVPPPRLRTTPIAARTTPRNAAASDAKQRLRFILERHSIKRINSIGKKTQQNKKLISKKINK